MAPAVAEAESLAADLERQLGIWPATPDIARKPARASLFPLVGESSGKVAQQEQQEEEEGGGVASGSNAGADSPARTPTPVKVEPTPRRWGKKSTKGVPRLKVAKDKVMKPKVTTPSTVKKKNKKMPEDCNQHVDAVRSNSARRKLDLDSSEIKTCFSRAELMGNLKCLAKIHGFNSEPTTHKRSKRGRKRKLMVEHKESGQLALLPYQRTPTVAASVALEPLRYCSTELDIPRPQGKVLGLTDETLRVYNVLTEWDRSNSESFEGFDIGSGPEWDATRHTFEHLVDIFIAKMFDLVGPRKYSQWGGSLVDSVVGTFLTQNSADHLSSQAFMTLVAKFPPRKRCYKANATPLVDSDDKNLNSNEPFDMFDFVDSHFDGYIDSEEQVDYDTQVKGHYGEDDRLIGDFAASMKEKNISTWDSDLMNLVKDKSGNPVCTESNLKKILASLRQPDSASNWKELREEAYKNGYNDKSQSETSDVADWESVLNAPFSEVAKCIAIRGQHNILTVRIREFLDQVRKAQDGSFDLDWLRFISREKAKKILLSIHGFGVKSADCVCLLSLRHRAFPVDVNVARIVTRLGWVKLQPLNGADFHLINLYPLLDDVQRYLWPRLCTIDKEKLYELHCLMITFGKVLCKKRDPNCRACPFSKRCIYYNSLLARYILPDDHLILEEYQFEDRVPEDICPYLLVVMSCPNDYIVEGTVLIPCRTANRGKFPLNGTYFQENEVFADYSSSRNPIPIPRECIGMLERRIVYFGSSIHSITKGQTRQDIQECFKEGYVCVRAFHRRNRMPMRLCGTLHATNTIKKPAGEKPVKRARTSPEGKRKNETKASATK